jgi:hypothetical protein
MSRSWRGSTCRGSPAEASTSSLVRPLRRARENPFAFHDRLFDPGHSLLIERLLARIQATFELEISIRTVFSMPTLQAMARGIERGIHEDIAALSDFQAEQLA